MMPRIIAIVQGRMASSRLPGKILADLNGQPVLAWVVRRAQRAAGIDQVVVATSVSNDDDVVEAFCKEQGFACSRGSLHDVLDRYITTARQYDAEVVVRLTGDCPFIDPTMLADNLRTFLAAQPPLDFAANRLPGDRTIPIGLDAEFCTMAALETAWRKASEPHQREHVMPFFYEHPQRFNILHIKHTPNYGHLRWTVDTAEDLELARRIAAAFPDDTFTWQDILALFERQPELAAINAGVQHKTAKDVDTRR